MQLAGVAETVNVTATSPTIDTTTTVIGVNASADLFNAFRCGATSTPLRAWRRHDRRRGRPAVLGSTGAENQYIIDGLNTTGVERAQRQAAELRLRRGDRSEDRRSARRVRPHDRRRHQRHHQVGRQHVQGSLFGFTEGGALQVDDSTGTTGRRRRPRSPTRQPWDVGVTRRLHRQGPAVVLRRVQPGVRDDADHASSARSRRRAPGVGSEIRPIRPGISSPKLTYRLARARACRGRSMATRRSARATSSPSPAPSPRGRAHEDRRRDPVAEVRGRVRRHASSCERSSAGTTRSDYSGPGKTSRCHRPDRLAEHPHRRLRRFQDRVHARRVQGRRDQFLGRHELKAGVDWETPGQLRSTATRQAAA